MSSNRFPGKVLAPFHGEPIILHVLRSVSNVKGINAVVVLTSQRVSDDPLVLYLQGMNVNVFRGSLENVFDRFRRCVELFPCDWILRLSGDSPMFDASIIQEMLLNLNGRDKYDLITTIFPRTHPNGQNAELIRVTTLNNIDETDLTPHDVEHVTPYLYRNSEKFLIKNIESGDPTRAELSFAVDTIADLHRLESLHGFSNHIENV